MADKSQTPPPPYESNNEPQSEIASDFETLPKYAIGNDSINTESRQTIGSNDPTTSDTKHRSDIHSHQHPYSSNGNPTRSFRPNRQNSTDQQSQLIESMSSTRKFFEHISVEPVAFLAILALYIEFPSIQDLIYTKICLLTVANHPNLTFASQTSQLSIDNISNSSLFNKGQIIDLSVGPSTTVRPAIQDHVEPNYRKSSRDHLLCDRFNKSSIPADIRQEITDADSLFWLKYQVIICLLCTLSCPYWGGMSDKIGRIIPLNVPILTAAVSNAISLIFGLLISLDSHILFDVNWLYIGAVLVGVSGGQAVIIVSSFSFISDNTSSGSRSSRVLVLEAVIYLSHSVGFLLTKYIMRLGLASFEHPWLNRHAVAFSICVILNLLSFVYSMLKLRHQRFHRLLNNFEREQQEAFAGAINSSTYSIADREVSVSASGSGTTQAGAGRNDAGFISAERLRTLTSSTPDDLDGPIVNSDKKFSGWSSFLTLNYYRQTYRTMTKQRESREIILLLLFCGFISAMSITTLLSLLYIYLRSDPFYWTTSQYSSWNATTSITRGFALVALTIGMKFVKSWNIPDALVASIGFLSKGFGLLMIGVAHDSSIINWALLAFVLSEYSMPPIRSMLSKLVIREEVGKIFSCLAALQSICFLVGNVIFYLAYTSLRIQDFFRLSFMVVAGLQLVAIVIMIYIYSNLRGRIIAV